MSTVNKTSSFASKELSAQEKGGREMWEKYYNIMWIFLQLIYSKSSLNVVHRFLEPWQNYIKQKQFCHKLIDISENQVPMASHQL